VIFNVLLLSMTNVCVKKVNGSDLWVTVYD